MKGYYFVNTDIRNTRAHTCQALNTVVALNAHIETVLVAPRYAGELDIEKVKENTGVATMPPYTRIANFGMPNPGTFAFAFFNIPAIWFLIQKKIRGDVDFVYIRANFFLPLALLAKLLCVPYFFETHRVPLSFGERFRDYLVSRFATGLVVISEHVNMHYKKYRAETIVSHDAVSLARFVTSVSKHDARASLGLSQEKKIAVYTGTVSSIKGAEYLYEAAILLPDVLFLLIGIIAKEFENKEHTQNLKILGKKEQKELPLYLKAADVLLLPHPDNEYSQSPMKLFEYMVSGVPILATKLPSIMEVLNDANSVLVEPNNAEALAQGIKKVLQDEQVQKRATQANIDVQNYTWEKRGESIARFIKINSN